MPKQPVGRILVVDDELSLMGALRDTLRDEGYRVTGVTSGARALAALGEEKFDLVLTDLVMPGQDGISLVEEALRIDPHLVAIIMTGHGSIPTAVEAMQAGAIDYVLKPIRLNALIPALERALTVRRLREKNAELESRVSERTAELEAANRELEAFSSSVSHDLRTPLRTITGFAELLLAREAAALPPEARRRVELIHAGADEMARLINGLLDFSRMGKKALEPGPVDVGALCREVFAGLGGEHAGRRVELRVGDLPSAVGDPFLLRQVMVNLVSNAIKFTRPRNRAVIEVGVAAVRDEPGPVYFVRDNGVGFEMRDAEKLFGVFQRLHSTSEFEGTGVGLATVRRIVERHGGRIWAQSSRDAGATFYFTLSPGPRP